MALHEFRSAQGVMTYTRRGLGDPLVLIHGVYPGASHHEFDRNIAALQRHFQVFALDLLGFGQSDTPRIPHSTATHQHLIRDFIQEVVGTRVHIVASGYGCGIAARLGVFDDGVLQRMVLIGPVMKEVYHDPPGVGDALARFMMGVLVGKSFYTVHASKPGLYEFLKEHYHTPKAITRELIDQMFVEANEPHKMLPYISALCGYFDTDLGNWLPSVRRPTLLLLGEDEPAPPKEWLREAAWTLGRETAVIPAAKDFPHQEQSAAVNKVLVEFLQAGEALVPSPGTPGEG